MSRGRHWTLTGAFAFACLSVVVRVVYLNVTERDFLKEQGDARSLRSEPIAAHRGMILDRRGEPLAVSTPAVAVWIDPETTSFSESEIGQIADALDLDGARLAHTVQAADGRFLYIKRRVDGVRLERIRALGLDGLRYRNEYRRYYPAGEVAAHLVGITDVDDVGLEGVELTFDAGLRGRPGSKTVLRDRRGNPIRDVSIDAAPRMGRELELSLDLRLQFFAYRELKSAVASHGATSASMVVLDARTGEILVLINLPSYNPNELTGVSYDRMRNRAVTDQYEPGSTIKPFSVLAALEEGAVTPAWSVDTSPGYFLVGQKLVEDPVNRGVISLAEMLKYSSQVGTAKLALTLERRAVFNVLARAGFGTPVQAGLPGEVSGVLSDQDLRSDIVRAAMAYGYGLSVTPLQLARGYLMLATRGRDVPVSIQKVAEPPRGIRVFSEQHVGSVLEMLEGVTDRNGTAPRARIDGVRVAGKTGTARKVGSDGYDEERHVALFAGIAPADQPRLVAVVVVNEPRGERKGGGAVAAPIFSRVVARALQILSVARASGARGGDDAA